MVQFLSAVLAFVSAVAVSAAAIPADVEARACAYTCGTVCYTSAQITAAKSKGYSLYQAGSTLNSYPHVYHNYEGFSFPTAAPWYEFPILSSHAVYTGGSPGADRVIFDSNGALDKLITHTGASGNNFVACT
ncbi:Ribonuclease/ribotoxin [Podospora appendiculata]|uniref:ribonuclease T1 n=1 Tax=Podospora appendiculata TaxID=314037 RepID=A0AAE1CAA1_9PEZI|nr:Ribonuclease/ribotoxin [Podospora appendiculata]